MKKWLMAVCLLFFAGIFYGHPPSGFDISYDSKKTLVTAVITHDLSSSMVKDTAKHYIKNVSVSVNGTPAVVQTLQDQEKASGETVIYKIRVKKGDKVSFTGVCSIFGSASKDFIVP